MQVPRFHPNPVIDEVRLADGASVWVIDDALLEPEAWRDSALSRWPEARETAGNAYPGPELALGPAADEALDLHFLSHLRGRLGVRRTLSVHCRLAMVTWPPARLQPRQWICHRDRFNVPDGQRAVASVLYLFDDPALGGTVFFRPRRPGFPTDLMVHESGTLAPAEFTAKYGIDAGYMTASNAWFERTGAIAPRFNRMIVYDGSLFHCSEIVDPARLDADPRRGRLTMNGFLTTRRAAT